MGRRGLGQLPIGLPNWLTADIAAPPATPALPSNGCYNSDPSICFNPNPSVAGTIADMAQVVADPLPANDAAAAQVLQQYYGTDSTDSPLPSAPIPTWAWFAVAGAIGFGVWLAVKG